MRKPNPPKFVTDYPSGKVDFLGRNLRLLSKNESEHIPPIRVGANAGIEALLVSTNRPFAKTKRSFKHYAKLATTYNLFLVVFASGASKKQDFITFAQSYPTLNWLIIEGPFNHELLGQSFNTDNSVFASPTWHDLSAKRNFGLILSRNMKWRKVIFLDDDITFPKGYFQKIINMTHHDGLLVASNTRDFPDLSVVTGAFNNVYGKQQLDSFLNSQAMVVNIENQWLGFSPRIYCEDWMFMLPYILKDQKPVWSGSVKQHKYNRYNRSRAEYEEAGDLLAEGIARLTIGLLAEKHRFESYEKALEFLLERANVAFWEREILQRGMFIRDLIEETSKLSLRIIKHKKINKSLRQSLTTLVGTEYSNGIRAEDLTAWVQAWVEDLKIWNAYTIPTKRSSRPELSAVVAELGIRERSNYQLSNRSSISAKQINNSKQSYRSETLAMLPSIHRSRIQEDGLESTRKIHDYMEQHNISMREMIQISSRLRYDRPIHFLRGNKPHATITMLIRQYEDPDIITEKIKEIIDWNRHKLPLHCVLWIVPENDKQANQSIRLYREYLIARIMLETQGSNIRLLSCIGHITYDESIESINQEYTKVIALAYWKIAAINSVNQPMYVVNSRNELLYAANLDSYLAYEFIPATTKLFEELGALERTRKMNNVPHNDELVAAEYMRSRLVLHHTYRGPTKSIQNYYSRSTSQLRRAFKKANISWLEADDQHYATIVHDSRQFDMLMYVQQIAAVLIPYGADDRYAVASIKLALAKLRSMSWHRGSHAEITVIIFGAENVTRLGQYRKQCIEVMTEYVQLPESVFLMSSIIQDDKISVSYLQSCDALIRYEHWLENDLISPRIAWIGPQSNSHLVPVCYSWLQRTLGTSTPIRSYFSDYKVVGQYICSITNAVQFNQPINYSQVAY